MKKLMIIAWLLFCVFAVPAWAHPPSKMKLKYDPGSKSLNVKMDHVTKDLQEHFVRRILVKVNDQKPQPFVYRFQIPASGVDVNLTVEANPGDTIVVTATCSKGGSTEAALKVPDGEDPDAVKK